jgi:hypothetical protein
MFAIPPAVITTLEVVAIVVPVVVRVIKLIAKTK